jgi:hypothetical protein
MVRLCARRIIVLLPLLALATTLGCAEFRQKYFPERPTAYYTPGYECSECAEAPTRPAKNVLVVSSGGLFGAYAAGFLNGWTNTGTRPEFDVVTGVSTGALIGFCSFLGPEYDQLAKETYTMVTRRDIYTIRSWYTIPYSSSIASNDPLKKRVDKAVSPEAIARIVSAHKAGRRLYVGTTNLETRRLVIWDMGAIACRGTPESVCLFKNILVASCAIPGMFPPMPIGITENGEERVEWHADGGTVAPIFVPQGLLTPENTQAAGGTTVHCLIAGKYFPETTPIRPRVLGVLKATVPAITYAHTRSELAAIYHQSQRANAGFVVTALPSDFACDVDMVRASTDELNRMFLEGYRYGSSGPTWDRQPPTETAAGESLRE